MPGQRRFIDSLKHANEEPVLIRGWVYRLRVLSRTTFIMLRDCSGEVQCVAPSDALKDLHLKLDDAVEIYGKVRSDQRAKLGHEVDILEARVLNRSSNNLPFNSSSNAGPIGPAGAECVNFSVATTHRGRPRMPFFADQCRLEGGAAASPIVIEKGIM